MKFLNVVIHEHQFKGKGKFHFDEEAYTKPKKPVALFTKILKIKNCRKCKTKIKKSFTKILSIILSVKIVLTLRVKLPSCRKCKILNAREIFVLSFIVSEKKRGKKMDDALALRLEYKRAIHC